MAMERSGWQLFLLQILKYKLFSNYYGERSTLQKLSWLLDIS